MPDSIANQAYVFLCSVFCGMLIAFLYDLFRIRRKTIRSRNLIVYIEDLLYWVIVAMLMFLIVYYSNDGEIRVYIFLGVVIGAVLYSLLFSRLVMSVSIAVLAFVKKLIKGLWTLFLYPLRLIYKIISWPIKILINILTKIFKGTGRILRSRRASLKTGKRIFKNARKKI